MTATDLFVCEDAAQRAGPELTGVPCFQDVYREYFDFVWSSAGHFSVEASAMDDLVQEVFIVVHAKLHTIENPKALRSWIYGVVRRVASNYRRARRTQSSARVELVVEEELRPPAPTPLEHAQRDADLQLLGILLGQLDWAKREVFALVELEQLTVPEVAEMLKIPLNTAYSRLRLARQAFETALARYGKREQGFRA